MHYIAFLILWLPQPDPTYTPKAAFIHHWDTYQECTTYLSSVNDPAVRKDLACLLVVVEPSKGIKE